MKRPPESASSVIAVIAVFAGERAGSCMMAVPRRIFVVCAPIHASGRHRVRAPRLGGPHRVEAELLGLADEVHVERDAAVPSSRGHSPSRMVHSLDGSASAVHEPERAARRQRARLAREDHPPLLLRVGERVVGGHDHAPLEQIRRAAAAEPLLARVRARRGLASRAVWSSVFPFL